MGWQLGEPALEVLDELATEPELDWLARISLGAHRSDLERRPLYLQSTVAQSLLGRHQRR
jgi:hypothetical protein